MSEIPTTIARAITTSARGEIAACKHLAAEWALQRLNQWHMSQVRRGDMITYGDGSFGPRPTPQAQRLDEILRRELLWRDREGRELPLNVPPPDLEGLLSELTRL